MTKLDAYEMPKSQFVEVEIYNIRWDTAGDTPNRSLPREITVTVDINEGNVITQAIEKVTELTGYTLKDLDIRPIDFDNVITPSENFEDTLEFEGEVYDKERL